MKNLNIKKMLIGTAVLIVAYIGYDTFVAPMARDRNDRAELFEEAASTIERRNAQAKVVRTNADEIEAELAEVKIALPDTARQQQVLAEISERWGRVGVSWESVSSSEPKSGPFVPASPSRTQRTEASDDAGRPAAAGGSEPTAEERAAAQEAAAQAARAASTITYDLNLKFTAADPSQVVAALNELRQMERILVVDSIDISFPRNTGDTGGLIETAIRARYFAFEPGTPDPIPQL